MTKESLVEKLAEKRINKTSDTSREGNRSRGDQLLELVR